MTGYQENDRVRVLSREATWDNAIREARNVAETTRNPRVIAARTPDGYVVGKIINGYANTSATDIFPDARDTIGMFALFQGYSLIIDKDPNAPDGITVRWEPPADPNRKETHQ
jgi:hypothetical protein